MLNSNAVDPKLISGFAQIKGDLEVKDSPIQGRGLFSRIDLKPGTAIFEIVGQKMQHEYNPSLSGENPNWIGTGYEEWLMLGPGDIAIYLNHSCKPNVIINEQQQLISMQAVKAGEELLLDYSTTELDPYWKMQCSCGHAECRKTLYSFQYLSDELQKEYGKYISPAFIRVAEVLALNKRAS